MTPFTLTTRRRLGIVATACLMSVALPAGSAWAQKSKTKDTAPVESTATEIASEFSLDIPTIDAVDSNVDDDTLRAIFSGEVVDNADALAGLSATSITIPEITMLATSTVDGEPSEATITFSDIVLTDVADGVAASISLAGMTLDAGDNGSAELGAITGSGFDIGGVLGLYGLVDAGGQTELETIYTDFSFEGGSFESPDASCTIGAMTVGEFKARPLNYSFAEVIALAQTAEAQGETPSPEVIGDLLRMYVDIFTAFESSPTEFGGFACDGIDDAGRPLSFSIAGMSMGGMKPGFYPSFSMDGLDIAVEGDGSVQVGNFTFKEMDLSAPIAAIQGAPDALDEAWFTANARALIPAMEGFSVSDVAVDVPDPETGERIQASVGAFDLTLGEYLNGIPTDLLSTASNIRFQFPEDSADPQLQQLLALGVTSIDAGFTIDAAWNEAENAIAIEEVSVTGADLATVKLAGTIANATEAIFGLDQDQALMAAMGVAISQLKLDVTDMGLSDIILTSVAAEQGSDAATMRPVFAGLAEGTIIGMLAGAAEAQKVGAAVNSFISGKAKYLTIELTAKEAPGLGMMDFMMAQEDPTLLIGKVTIDATAK